jgi:apolipoprotein N-acyltransferase
MRSIPLRLWTLALVSAILQILPFSIAGPVPLWRRMICWFCLVPLLYALTAKNRHGDRLSPLQSALIGYLCGVLWYLGNCYWIFQTMHLYGDIPELTSFGILILFALYLGLYYALFGWIIGLLRRSLTQVQLVLVVPFLWVTVELARDRITGFPWDLLGYTQVDNSTLTRLAPLGGVMLLSFVIASVNALALLAFREEKKKMQLRSIAAFISIAAVLQFGVLFRPAPDTANHRAVLLQENLAVGAEGRDIVPFPIQQKYQQFIDWSLHPLTPTGATSATDPSTAPTNNSRPDLIIWPEAPADFATSDPQFRSELGALARAAHSPVIAGSIGVDFDPSSTRGYREFGSAAVFNRDGSYLGRYDKIHRVPWGEYVPYARFFSFAGKLISGVGNMKPGTQHKVFDLSGHSTGIFICYESIFGDEVRQFVLNGAQVLVNISDDGWYGDSGAPWEHLDMARMRAIENNRWLLRDTNTGITTAIDPHGRGDFLATRHVRAAFAFNYGYREGTTFYTRHGDWFAWLCAFITLAALAFAYARKPFGPRRNASEPSAGTKLKSIHVE